MYAMQPYSMLPALGYLRGVNTLSRPRSLRDSAAVWAVLVKVGEHLVNLVLQKTLVCHVNPFITSQMAISPKIFSFVKGPVIQKRIKCKIVNIFLSIKLNNYFGCSKEPSY